MLKDLADLRLASGMRLSSRRLAAHREEVVAP